jgi:lipoate-protein ligase A
VTKVCELNPIRLLNLGSVASWQTQAVYHTLAEMMTANSPDTIIICQPQTPYLCLGYHQIFETTLDRAACERLNLPVYRRRTGGGATYLDAHQLFYQCVFHHRRLPFMTQDIYALLLAAPVATLRRLGLKSGLRDINEVEANGRRIAGIGGGRVGQAGVVVGNLLFDFDFETMAQVWRAPWPSFRKLAAAALRERVTTLGQLLGPVPLEKVQAILLEEFSKALGRPLKPDTLTGAELAYASKVARRLASAKYLNLHQDNGWTALPRPLKIAAGVFIHAIAVEINGYKIQASFRVCDGLIEEARLASSPPNQWKFAETELRGVPFKTWQQQLKITEGNHSLLQNERD